MKNIINSILNRLNLQIIRKNDDYHKKINLYKNLFISNSKQIDNTLGCIVFSMDRALQLDALLRSLSLNRMGECKVVVIYKSSNKEHKKAYDNVIEKFAKDIVFLEESDSFKTILNNAIDLIDTGKLFFLVDDIVFTEKVDFDMLSKIDTGKYIFSLRMGEHLNYSYVVDKPQELPVFVNKNDNYLYWKWNEGELDWAYPLSVDGHVFNRLEIKVFAEYYDFKAPNSFEEVLQKEKELFMYRMGMSYKKARIVNNPCNKVQSEVANLFGTMHQDDLLKIWQEGKEIDIIELQGYVNRSVHEEIVFGFKDRV